MESAASRTGADPIIVAVVGAGYFARFHIEAWGRIAGARLAGIAEPDPGRRAEAAKLAPGAQVFADAEAMCAACRPDIVDLATPPETHLALVTAAVRQARLVICQKPLAPTYDEARAVVDAAEAAGVPLVVHENFRFTPWHREMARLRDAGRFGRLHGLTMRLRPGDGQGADAYLARQPYFQRMARFLVHETAVHWVDVFRYLGGEVGGVFARLRRLNPAIRGEDAGLIVFDLAHGAAGLFDGNRLNDFEADNPRRTMGEMWLEGEAGVMRLDGAARLWWKPHGQAASEHPYAWQDRAFAGDCVHALQSHVVHHLRDGGALENHGRAYLRNLEVVEAIYRSAETGAWINLSA